MTRHIPTTPSTLAGSTTVSTQKWSKANSRHSNMRIRRTLALKERSFSVSILIILLATNENWDRKKCQKLQVTSKFTTHSHSQHTTHSTLYILTHNTHSTLHTTLHTHTLHTHTQHSQHTTHNTTYTHTLTHSTLHTHTVTHSTLHTVTLTHSTLHIHSLQTPSWATVVLLSQIDHNLMPNHIESFPKCSLSTTETHKPREAGCWR